MAFLSQSDDCVCGGELEWIPRLIQLVRVCGGGWELNLRSILPVRVYDEGEWIPHSI
jgi:hypothetical protein